MYCYPDLVKVGVALDTGDVVSFESEGYLMNHGDRTLPAPAVSEAEAAAQVDGSLTVLAHQLALIPTGGEYEVLCHEFKWSERLRAATCWSTWMPPMAARSAFCCSRRTRMGRW